MARKKTQTKDSYTVINGCDVPGKRYEIGDAYDPKDHDDKVTQALLRLKCIGETNGDS
jgi:hypothetical protein